MFRILFLSSFLLLSACASLQSPPMKTGDIKAVKSGKTAVMFYDPAEQINYSEDSYRVLAIFTNTTQGSYKGFWDINKDMSNFHAVNLKKLGIRAESAYKKFNTKEVAYFNKKQKNMLATWKDYTIDGNASKLKKLVDINLRKRLIQKGYDYLIWIPFRGYRLHVRTLGLDPMESMGMNYILHDLKKDKLLWSGVFNINYTIDLKGRKSKDFLEKNNLKGYKSRLKALTRLLYEGRHNGTVGVELGLVQAQ